jgi:hypothetical protein
MIRDLLAEGADAGQLRDDVAADELASFCLHALTAAGGMASKAAVRRPVAVIMAGLRRDVSRDPTPPALPALGLRRERGV